MFNQNNQTGLNQSPFQYDLEKEFKNNPEKCRKELEHYKSQFFKLKRLLELNPHLAVDIKILMKGYNAMGNVYKKGLEQSETSISSVLNRVRVD